MAKYKNRNNPHSKKRQGKGKPVAATPAFEKELASKKRSNLVMIVVGIIVAVMVGSMFSQVLLTPASTTFKPNFNVSTDAEQTITFTANKISFGESLNRKEETYYVLYGESQVTAQLVGKVKSVATYQVDTTLALNKEIRTDVEKGKNPPTTLSEIKLSEEVGLLVVENNVIKNYIQGQTNIEEFLNK